MNNGKYLYGLDISLKQPAVTVYDLENRKFVLVDSFNTMKIYATREYKGLDLNSIKLKKITEWLWEIIREYPPYIIAIERMFSKFKSETQVIAKATGVIQCMLWNKPQHLYAPKEVKAKILHGDATKEEIANAIKAKYNDIKFRNDDESDSFAVVLTFLIDHELIEWEKPETKKKIVKQKPKSKNKIAT